MCRLVRGHEGQHLNWHGSKWPFVEAIDPKDARIADLESRLRLAEERAEAAELENFKLATSIGEIETDRRAAEEDAERLAEGVKSMGRSCAEPGVLPEKWKLYLTSFAEKALAAHDARTKDS